MHYPRAILISIISYIVTLAVGLGILLLAGKQLSDIQTPTQGMIMLSMALAVIFTMIAAFVYFRPPHVRAGGKLGFGFGLVATLVGFGLDGVLAGTAFLQGRNPGDVFSTAYDLVLLLPMLALGLVATTLVGVLMGKQQIS